MNFWQNYCLIPVKRHQNNRPVPSNNIVPISLNVQQKGYVSKPSYHFYQSNLPDYPFICKMASSTPYTIALSKNILLYRKQHTHHKQIFLRKDPEICSIFFCNILHAFCSIAMQFRVLFRRADRQPCFGKFWKSLTVILNSYTYHFSFLKDF